MARGKTMVRAPALDNALIRALVAELPAPAKDGFPSRESWFAMARNAFDVVYGPADDLHKRYAAAAEDLSRRSVDPPPPNDLLPRRFYIDHDGFAMVDGQPLAFNDLPSIVTLYDERAGIEAGDAGAILWKDVGTVKTGLPAGVRLVPAATRQDAA